MGRKGVSKRKSRQSKKPTASTDNTNNAVSKVVRVSESPITNVTVKGEAVAAGKGRKKK